MRQELKDTNEVYFSLLKVTTTTINIGQNDNRAT